MKRKLLLIIFSLLTIGISFAGNDATPTNDVDDFYTGVGVSLYPNPSTGVAFLEIESEFAEVYNVKVVNLIGKEMLRAEVQSGQKLKIDLQNVPSGVYFVQIERGDVKVTKRLIIR
ncbi:MAG: T9SS type A sorting domain-containing protein [Bacteroidia bacterium]|nr:T9SS type A sorting domain-containing protein [Bacteroidia bacterium]